MNDNKLNYNDAMENFYMSYKVGRDDLLAAPHFHSQYEIFYNIHGADGFYVDSEFYKCSERDLIIVPRFRIHRVIVRDSSKYVRCCIRASDYIIKHMEIMCHSDSVLNWLKSDSDDVPRITRLSSAQHKLFLDITQRYTSLEGADSNLPRLTVFMEGLAFLGECFKKPITPQPYDDAELVMSNRIIKIIEQQFKTVTVSGIASQVYASSDHINRVFKSDTGTTINEYIIMRRIAEAEKQLYLGKSAKEACFLSGFGNYSNFLKRFKKYKGYTPKEFIKLYRGTEL